MVCCKCNGFQTSSAFPPVSRAVAHTDLLASSEMAFCTWIYASCTHLSKIIYFEVAALCHSSPLRPCILLSLLPKFRLHNNFRNAGPFVNACVFPGQLDASFLALPRAEKQTSCRGRLIDHIKHSPTYLPRFTSKLQDLHLELCI